MLLSVALLLVLLAALGWLWRHLSVSPYRFPPLVPGLFHLVQADLPCYLLSLAQKYGPLYRFHFGIQGVVVLNSKKAIEEAFVKKWIHFSGRPQTFIIQLVNKDGQDLSLGDYTPLWKAHRKLARSAVVYVQNNLEPVMEKMAQDFCKRLLVHGDTPVNFTEEIFKFTCSIICFLTFGDKREFFVQEICDCIQELLLAWDSCSAQILNILPFLKFFSNLGVRRLKQTIEKRDRIVQKQLRLHKETMVEGQPRDVTDYMLQKLKEQGEGLDQLSEGHIHMTLVDLFIGGTETTAYTISWAVAFLLHHPEIQRRLQEELDQELGPGFSGNPPKYKDRARFPLLNATITEVLRLRPAAPLAIPHFNKKPSSVCGFDIPKNSIIIPNIYGAHHDESVWTQPNDFQPDRFLGPDPSPLGIPFGCGTRLCLGESLARFEVFQILAHLLQAFTLLPEDSHTLPSLKPIFGINTKISDFQVRLLPRGG